MAFINAELPMQKINKSFIIQFYQIIKENSRIYPEIDENKATKKELLEHLENNFLEFQEFYFDALNYI